MNPRRVRLGGCIMPAAYVRRCVGDEDSFYPGSGARVGDLVTTGSSRAWELELRTSSLSGKPKASATTLDPVPELA